MWYPNTSECYSRANGSGEALSRDSGPKPCSRSQQVLSQKHTDAPY